MKKYLKKYKEKLEEMSPDIIISETDPLAEWFSHSLLKSYPYRIPTIFLTVFAVRMAILPLLFALAVFDRAIIVFLNSPFDLYDNAKA